jgi:hypothetical protein
MGPIELVHEGDTGPEVSNLHIGLLFLIRHQGGISPNDRKVLLKRFAPEVSQNRFGEVTRSLVAMYQAQLKNWPNYWPPLPPNIATIVQSIPANTPGDVDEGTAEALNWLVQTFGGMASPPPPRGKLRPATMLQKKRKGRR